MFPHSSHWLCGNKCYSTYHYLFSFPVPVGPETVFCFINFSTGDLKKAKMSCHSQNANTIRAQQKCSFHSPWRQSSHMVQLPKAGTASDDQGAQCAVRKQTWNDAGDQFLQRSLGSRSDEQRKCISDADKNEPTNLKNRMIWYKLFRIKSKHICSALNQRKHTSIQKGEYWLQHVAEWDSCFTEKRSVS